MSNEKPYSSITVAKYLLSLAKDKGKDFNVTKTQKLLYIVYGYFLSKDRVLLDEKPKAWPYGPVFPKTTKKKIYQNIEPLDSEYFSEIKDDKEVSKFFEIILKVFGDTSSNVLVDWTHSKGAPWHLTKKRYNFEWNDIIPDKYIKPYFSKKFPD